MKRECKIDVKLRDTILEQVGNSCKNSNLIATPLATINVRLRSGEKALAKQTLHIKRNLLVNKHIRMEIRKMFVKTFV